MDEPQVDGQGEGQGRAGAVGSPVAGRTPGKVVIVTGAARGQGAAEVRALVAQGAVVVATDVADEPADDLAGAAYARLDVADPAGWARVVGDVAAQHGRIDALVNNAGTTWRARVGEVEPDDAARVMAVNATGPLLGIQACTPHMPRGSSVVNVGSVAALTGHYAVAYTMSKWALRGLGRAACLELGPRGIRVNTIHPGYIETPMTASAPAAFRAANLAETPLGRAGVVDDVAPLVVFLVSDESAFISGAEIAVDGGMTAHGGVKSIADSLVIS